MLEMVVGDVVCSLLAPAHVIFKLLWKHILKHGTLFTFIHLSFFASTRYVLRDKTSMFNCMIFPTACELR